MSRSKKKTKITGITTAKSEKTDKQEANRKLRRKAKEAIPQGKEELPKLKEISNVWSFSKDGKNYNKEMSKKDMRKYFDNL